MNHDGLGGGKSLNSVGGWWPRTCWESTYKSEGTEAKKKGEQEKKHNKADSKYDETTTFYSFASIDMRPCFHFQYWVCS